MTTRFESSDLPIQIEQYRASMRGHWSALGQLLETRLDFQVERCWITFGHLLKWNHLDEG